VSNSSVCCDIKVPICAFSCSVQGSNHALCCDVELIVCAFAVLKFLIVLCAVILKSMFVLLLCKSF